MARSIGAPILDLLNNGKTELVYSADEITTKSVEIIATNAWFMSHDKSVFNWNVGALSVLPFAKSQESWRAEGKGLEDELKDQLEHSFGPELARTV